MSGLKAFFKENRRTQNHVMYAASQAFLDENGKPVEWEIRALTSREADAIRDSCTSIHTKGNRIKVDGAKYNRMMAAACTVFPDLNDKALQDSYGVVEPGELLLELLINDGEYQAYCKKVLEVSGYHKADAELVEEAKN